MGRGVGSRPGGKHGRPRTQQLTDAEAVRLRREVAGEVLREYGGRMVRAGKREKVLRESKRGEVNN
jgi:hypothetical protein